MQIAPAWSIPKVMMRINDELRRVQDFLLPGGEPIFPDGKVMLQLRL
jgi:hypothetical protein